MFFPVDGYYKGKIFVRSVKALKIDGSTTSKWVLLGLDSNYNSTTDVPQPDPGETN